VNVRVLDEHFQISTWKKLKNQVEVLVFGGEYIVKCDDVGMGQLLKIFHFANCVHGESIFVFRVDLDFLNCNE
jgi:hypothetical protein